MTARSKTVLSFLTEKDRDINTILGENVERNHIIGENDTTFSVRKKMSILGDNGENNILSDKEGSFSVRKEQTILSENVNKEQSIEELYREIRAMKVYYAEVTVVKHRRRHNGRVYEWIEKRISIPNDWDTDIVYVFKKEDFERLMYAIGKLLEECRNKSGNL